MRHSAVTSQSRPSSLLRFHTHVSAASSRRWFSNFLDQFEPNRVSRTEQDALIGPEATSPLPMSRMRNFCIIAHIDHGKSTLADRLLEATGNITEQEGSKGQVLDSLEVERERGITVKAQTASLFYRSQKDGLVYLLNLIDTPGHVDFSYEVSRSLAACQGALLLVDATQGKVRLQFETVTFTQCALACQTGIQAQTLANYQLAKQANLDIVPIITKIDLTTADPEGVAEQMINTFDVDLDSIIYCSSKSGEGIPDIFPSIIERIRAPVPRFDSDSSAASPSAALIVPSDADAGAPTTGAVTSGTAEQPTGAAPIMTAPALRALLFDSWFDQHRGVICLVQIADGAVKQGDRIASWHQQKQYEVQEVGILQPRPRSTGILRCGQAGYVIANIRHSRDARLGDTFLLVCQSRRAALIC